MNFIVGASILKLYGIQGVKGTTNSKAIVSFMDNPAEGN
jgi:hypothetical protein